MWRRSKVLLTAFLVLLMSVQTVWAEETISLEFVNADYVSVFETLANLAGLNALVDSSVSGTGSFSLQNVSVQEALDLVSGMSGFSYRIVGSTLLVASQSRLTEYESKQLRHYMIKYAEPETIKSALALVMSESDIYIDEDSRLLFLQVSPSILSQVEAMIELLDQPSKITIDARERSLLDIFTELTERLRLNLIADPALERRTLAVRFQHEDPWEIIEQIKSIANVDVQLQDETLVVSIRTPSEEEVPLPQKEKVKIYRLDFGSPEVAKTALQMFVPEDKVVVDAASVMVRAGVEQLSEIDAFIEEFDIPPTQVLIEAWVQEIGTEDLQSLGIEWKGVPNFSGTRLITGDMEIPAFIELEWKPWELFLALKALENNGKSKLLARPQIATINGQEASIFIGDRVPVRVKSGEDSEKIEYIESGIHLNITPQISSDGYITTRIRQEVSTFVPMSDGLPQTRTREAETIVRVLDGQPIVIGGLIQESLQEYISGIPFVSKLPILGRLFQWTESENTQTEMVIFMVPRIIDGSEGLMAPHVYLDN